MSDATQILLDSIERLQDFDFGYAEGASPAELERLLRELEDIVDTLDSYGYVFPEADQAIHFFQDDPALSRTYIYGPTDIGDGIGLLEKLKEMVGPY